MKVHDVSLVMRAAMPTWPGEDGPRVTPLRRIATGDSANVSVVTFGNHTGTHVDPPVHFIEGAATVDRLPLDALVGPCRVLEFDAPGHISAAWLDAAGLPDGAERILFKTRNEPQGPEKEGYPTHKTLLGAQIVIIEGLDLRNIRPGEYELACGAIKFEGGDGAPARVFLIER